MQLDTPSHPGGVSEEFKQRAKDRRDRERGVYVSSKDRDQHKSSRGTHRHISGLDILAQGDVTFAQFSIWWYECLENLCTAEEFYEKDHSLFLFASSIQQDAGTYYSCTTSHMFT